MGMSMSAEISYGVIINEEYGDGVVFWPSWTYDADEDTHTLAEWEEEYGHTQGWEDAPFPEDWPSFHTTNEERKLWQEGSSEYQAWSASRDRLRELVEASGVDMSMCGHSDGERQQFFVVKASVQEATWEIKPIELGPLRPVPTDDVWRVQLDHVIEALQLPVVEEPRWYLSASYG